MREMSLAAEAGFERDLGDREAGSLEEVLRDLDSPGCEVAMRGDADGALEGARESGRAHRGRARKLGDGDARGDARVDTVERLLEKVAGEFLRELARSFMPVRVLGEIDAEGLSEELGEPRASASAAAGFFGERRAGRAREGIVETRTERQTSQLARADAGLR